MLRASHAISAVIYLCVDQNFQSLCPEPQGGGTVCGTGLLARGDMTMVVVAVWPGPAGGLWISGVKQSGAICYAVCLVEQLAEVLGFLTRSLLLH